MRALLHCRLIIFGVLASSVANAALTYNATIAYDDGFAQTGIGGLAATDQVIRLNAFQATQDMEVFGVDIAFGPNPGNGAPVQVYLWSDPNNDGDPSDAVLEETISSTTFDANFVSGVPLTFSEFLFVTPRTYTLGQYFFLGYQSAGYGLVDVNSPYSRSFVYSDFTSSLTDPNNLSGAAAGGNMGVVAGTPGALNVRALVAVPEPSTYLAGITAVGLVGMVIYRRRRKRTAEAE